MRILHVVKHDGLASAYRLHLALRRLGHDSVMYVAERRSDDPNVVAFRPPMDPASRIRRQVRKLRIRRDFDRYQASRPAGRYESFNDDRTAHGGDMLSQLPPADVAVAHAILQFVDVRAFFKDVPARMPVIRALHDMSFFTGGCHIDAGCGRYTVGCGACPQLGSQDLRDLSHRIWERRRAALQAANPRRLHVVSPSRWLAQAVEASPLLRGVTVSVIPHGVDPEVFAPRDRSFVRSVLDLPANIRIVAFVAEPLTRPVKRLLTLVAALERMPESERPLLLTVGSGTDQVDVPVAHVHLGYVGNERFLSLVYSAADVVAVPSHQEAFSLVTLEAASCGVPVIGSAVGGIAEIVQDGLTGLLVPPDDISALGSALSDLLKSSERLVQMGAAARRLVQERFTLDLMARRYIELCEQMARAASTAPGPSKIVASTAAGS